SVVSADAGLGGGGDGHLRGGGRRGSRVGKVQQSRLRRFRRRPNDGLATGRNIVRALRREAMPASPWPCAVGGARVTAPVARHHATLRPRTCPPGAFRLACRHPPHDVTRLRSKESRCVEARSPRRRKSNPSALRRPNRGRAKTPASAILRSGWP